MQGRVLVLLAALVASAWPCESFTTSVSSLPLKASGSAASRVTKVGTRSRGLLKMQWDIGRFAKTFTTFNGIPFLGPLGKAATVRQPSPVQKGSDLVLWDFDKSQGDFAKMWAPLDDVVMGGVSESNVRLSPTGTAVLAGATSSQNNGGFCSARTRNVDVPYDLTGFKGIAIRVKSSIGMRYKLILRDTNGWDTIAWCKSFDLQQGKDVDIRVPFKDFIPVFRGTILKTQSSPIDQSNVFSVQIMVSKYEYDGALNPNFTEGPFELEFGSIKAYK